MSALAATGYRNRTVPPQLLLLVGQSVPIAGQSSLSRPNRLELMDGSDRCPSHLCSSYDKTTIYDLSRGITSLRLGIDVSPVIKDTDPARQGTRWHVLQPFREGPSPARSDAAMAQRVKPKVFGLWHTYRAAALAQNLQGKGQGVRPARRLHETGLARCLQRAVRLARALHVPPTWPGPCKP